MSGALTASFTLRLIDEMSGPLRALRERFEQLRSAASRLGVSGFSETTRAIDRTTGSLDKAAEATRELTTEMTAAGRSAEVTSARFVSMGDVTLGRIDRMKRAWSGFMGGGSGAAGVSGLGAGGLFAAGYAPGSYGRGATSPVRAGRPGGDMETLIAAAGAEQATSFLMRASHAAAEYENALVHTAITAHLRGPAADAMIGRLRSQYDSLALSSGQKSSAIAETAYNLQLTGMDPNLLSTVIAASVKAATAYRTNVSDVSATAYALSENLKLRPDEIAQGLATLATAGKEGHFTLDRMATYFPQIAALGGSFGMTGIGAARELAAGMQISMKNVGMNDPGKAATNMQDFLQYIASPIAKREFARYGGIDLDRMIKAGGRAGLSPMETVIRAAGKLTGGDRMKIGELFHNSEAAQFVVAMLQHKDEFDHLMSVLKSVDVHTIDKDFDEVSKHMDFAVRRVDTSFEVLTTRLGFAFEPVLRAVAFGLNGLTKALIWLDDNVPYATSVIVSLVGAFAMLVAAAGAWLLLHGALVAAWRVLSWLLTPLRWVVVALGLAAEALGLPLWALLAIIGAVGVALVEMYRNWDAVKQVFWQLVDWLRQLAQTIAHLLPTSTLPTQGASGIEERARQGGSIDGGNTLPGLPDGALDMPPVQFGRGRGGHRDLPGAPGRLDVRVTTDPGLRAEVTSPNREINVRPDHARGPTVSRP